MEKLLSDALVYAKGLINTSKDQEAIIWHSRKSLLFNDNSTWVKKQSGDFDVTMGSFDGAEVCELVGLYLLSLLRKSGFSSSLSYDAPQRQTQPKKARKRKVIWFNPPFDQGVYTNIAKRFLCLIDKHFPKHHHYHRLFNRNTVKVSYSCMPNMAAIITSHNTKVLQTDSDSNTLTCSCRNKQQCPLERNCLAECIVYQTTVTAATKPTRHYFGLTEGNFKTRYNTHMHSFRAEQCRKVTELSKK